MLETWPFWAPSKEAAVREALELAGVGDGTHVVDLGCGDGQVLLAAARLGATVGGIEADPDLVEEARENLAGEGVEADIVEGDLLDPALDVEADVLFAYLAPATLQRLLPTLRPRRGTTLVTVDFDVPGLVPNRRSGAARLYRMPGRRRRVLETGWPCAGTLLAVEPDCQSLSCLDAVHPAGPVRVRASRNLSGLVSAVSGADRLDEPSQLAVDLRWEELAEGTVVAGVLRSPDLGEHAVIGVVTDQDEGMWELEPAAVDAIRRSLRRRHPPSTIDEVLEQTVA